MAYANTERYFARYQPDDVREMLETSGFLFHSLARRESSVTWLHFVAETPHAS